MKKIINGKRYDTETAKMVARWCDDLSYTDFKHIDEDLYRKRTGEFFIHGRGGAMTKYASQCWGGYGAGEGIVPITKEEATAWVECHCSDEIRKEIFGKVEE